MHAFHVSSLTFLLLVQISVQAAPANEPITSPGCDFVVWFPMKTDRQADNGTQGLRAQSVYDERNPLYLRAECNPIFDPTSVRNGLSGLLEQQAKAAGLEHPQFSIESTAVGTVGTYSGMKSLPGVSSSARYVGKVVVGVGSILHLIALDPEPAALSPQATAFFSSIETKRTADAGSDPQVQHALQVSKLYGVMLGQKIYLETTLENCGIRQPALETAAASTLADWNERNHGILDRAASLSVSMQRTLYGNRSVEQGMELQQKALAENRVKLLRSLEKAPVAQLKCDEFVRSIGTGKLDYQVQFKDALKLLEK
jgi:hypothetical protein